MAANRQELITKLKQRQARSSVVNRLQSRAPARTTFAGGEVPTIPVLNDFLAGINSAIADGLGLVVDASETNPFTSSIAGPVLNAGRKFLELEGNANGEEIIREAFREAGIIVDAPEGALSARMGEQALGAALVVAGLGAAAPTAAATSSQGFTGIRKAITDVVQRAGQFIQRRPGVVAAEEAGAVALSQPTGELAAGALGESFRPAGEIIGGVTGGIAGPTMFRAGRVAAAPEVVGGVAGAAAGSAVGQPVIGGVGGAAAGGALRRTLRRGGQQATPEGPLAPVGGNPDDTVAFARRRVEGQATAIRQAIEREINKAVPGEGINMSAPAAVRAASTRLRTGIERARSLSDRMQRRMWNRVDGKQRVDIDPLIAQARQINSSARTRRTDLATPRFDEDGNIVGETRHLGPSIVPGEFLDEISKMVRVEDGRLVPQPQTIDSLIALRTRIRDRRRGMERNLLGGGISPGLRRQFLQLESAVLDTIQRHVALNPGDQSVLDALEFTRQQADLFKRDLVAEALQMSQTVMSQPNVRPGDTAGFLFRDREGLQQVQDIASNLRRPSLSQQASMSVRAMFREAGQDSPQGAIRFVEDNRDVIEALQSGADDVFNRGRKLQNLLEDEDVIRRSSFARFQIGDRTGPEAVIPEVRGAAPEGSSAIEAIMRAPNKAAAVREVMMNISTGARQGETGAEDALEGMRSGMIQWLVDRADTAVNLRRVFENNEDAMKAALDDRQFRRLEQIVTNIDRVASGEERLATAIFRQGGIILSRIFGAQAGGVLARATGGGTVQTPAIVSQAARAAVEQAMAGIPPDKLLAEAVLNPRVERMLVSAVPQTASELRRFERVMGAVIGGLEGTREAMTEREAR